MFSFFNRKNHSKGHNMSVKLPISNVAINDPIKLEVFVDNIDSRSKFPVVLSVEKEMTIKNLRKKISTEKNIDVDNLVLMINYKFWEDDFTIYQAVSEMNEINNIYTVYAVIITEDDEEKINYDIEKHLKDKYSTTTNHETSFELIEPPPNGINVKEMENVPTICTKCGFQKPSKSIVVLEYCKHEFCRDCLEQKLNRSIGENVKCLQPECQKILIDHEFQKILGSEGYDKWQILFERKTQGVADFKIPKAGWICGKCTFLNKPYVKFCATCHDNRPVEYKIPIFYVATVEEQHIKEVDDVERKKQEEEAKLQEEEKMKQRDRLISLSKQSVTMNTEEVNCPICGDDYGPNEAVVLHACLHIICKDCLKSYLLTIEDAQVKCPTNNCVGLVEDREISGLLTPEEYLKYEHLNLRMAEAKEQFSFHCKAVNCTAWIVYDGNVANFVCALCKSNNCIRCEAIHDKMTCQQYQMVKLKEAQDPNLSKNDQFIQSMINSGEAMKCPGCKMIVEKNRGCDGVLCRSCGMMICWATKGPRWGPKGKGDKSGGCGCRFFWGRRCHPNCHYCH